MYARMTVLQMAPPRVEAARERLEQQILDALGGQEGFIRFMLLVDRHSGRSVGITFWETEEAMQASAKTMEQARARAIDVSGAVGQADVQSFEVLIDTEGS